MEEQDPLEQSVNDPPPSLGRQPNAGNEAPTANSAPSRAVKKRTKTGCLTCRQRRIKCDEKKPICANCIKSRRECKGYAQRVIFKDPIGIHGTYDSQQLLNAQIQPMPQIAPFINEYDGQGASLQQRPGGSRHPILAPKPTVISATGAMSASAAGSISNQMPQGTNTAPFYYPSAQSSARLPSTSESAVADRRSISQIEPVAHHPPEALYPAIGTNDTTWNPDSVITAPSTQSDQNLWANPSGYLGSFRGAVHNESYYPHTAPGFQHTTVAPPQYGSIQEQSQFHQNLPFVSPISSEPAIDEESDDYYDVESDEEMAQQTQAEDSNQLSLIMTSARQQEHQLRSFTTHLNEPNVLASYRPTLGSSPLNNPKTARIFIHFIHSTGPSMSIFERHPFDSSLVFGGLVPAAQQALWTYTLPLKALEHPALLQAILAISSFHIASLQQAPPMVSLKHYHYALKRIGTAVSLPARRRQVGTLAATLLLGYYEVMAADHSKWNSHVAGSAQLIREIDFAGITRDLRAHRRRVWAQREYMSQSDSFADYYNFHDGASEDDPFGEKEMAIDERLIGILIGRAVNFDEFGQIYDGKRQSSSKNFTRKDIENYRIQCDLYWWYCKQDMYQSMISGNKLFLPYSLWGQCPPRAGVGRLDAIYGTADHLWLLIARITNFGYRDRKRKLKVARATGSDWKPTPSLFKFMGRFAGGGQGSRGGQTSDASKSSPEGGPVRPGPRAYQSDARPPQPGGQPMYGMVPSHGPPRLPSSFAKVSPKSNITFEQDGDDDEMTDDDAESEWESILSALDTFGNALGRDFQPLPADITPPISTPFGPALQYRTHTIGVIWALYFTGRILLHRLHPSMPPAMMVAAGVAAVTTAEYAQIIGKIAAGIYYPQLFNLEADSLSPTLGSCLVEMTVPIFFAAVQYTDPSQRGWTVAKLRNVSRLTGWKSSIAIASGCENSWVVAAKQGRGPPYERTSGVGRREPPEGSSGRPESFENNERRFVAVSKSDRAHWAMGILSLEDDILNLEIDDRT